MKAKVVVALFPMLILSNASFARIGESEAQTDHRYGKPAGKWDDYLGFKKLYHWHGFDVMVTFSDGVSQREMFVKHALETDAHMQKRLGKVVGVGQNGIIYDAAGGVFTTQPFEEKYLAARKAAWAKRDEKPNQ
jgi:hypothetical protein